LLALFKQIILSNVVEYQDFRGLLEQRLTEGVGKHGIYNLAKCIAVSTASASDADQQRSLSEMMQQLDGSKTPTETSDVRKVELSLLITGDFGRSADLSTYADSLEAIYVGYFDSWADDLKNAASYALGNASMGSPSTFLQAIIRKLDEDNKKQQYLLLSALREFIRCNSRALKEGKSSSIASSLPTIVTALEAHCADDEEGVRTMVAECLGSLTCLQPDTLLKKLAQMQNDHSEIRAPEGTVAEDDETSKRNANVYWTIASSIKLAIAGKVDTSQLAAYMPTFVKLLQQESISVRNASLLMVYSAVHHMPQVVQGLFQESIMPSLYEVAKLKMERKVDLGPFTHTVDDALPLRKAALSIFATCMENIPNSLDISDFMPILAHAMGDAEDIQLHAHQILISMCSRQPSHVATVLETFIEPLEKTMNKKPGQKTGTELERLNDWIKSSLRVMVSLSKLDGAMNNRKFSEFVDRVKANSKFTHALKAIEEEI
jgi:cullin-associated NEDD8-dissociated protein 1